MKIELDSDRLAQLFPAFLLLNGDGSIVDIGPSLAQQLPNLRPGTMFRDHFRSKSGGDIPDFSELSRSRSSLQLLSCNESVQLSGSVIETGQYFLLAARHVPAQFSLGINGLQMSDFGADDPIVPSLLLVGLQKSMIEESRQIAIELSHERRKSVDLYEKISRISGYMAHDFNNILSIIRLNSERIINSTQSGTRIRRLGEMISDTADRGSEITNSLMAFSGRKQDSRLAIDLDSLILENITFFDTIVGANICIDINLESSGCMIDVSRIGMLTCLINLLINSRDAQPSGGRIKISTNACQIPLQSVAQAGVPTVNCVALMVSDSGCGMSEETLKRAFEPLFTTKHHGNGMGLASIQEFISEMGGDICLDSSLGKGTTCYIYLPAIELANNCLVIDNSTMVLKAENFSRELSRVLLVEDEPFALDALTELVESLGHEVVPCSNAAEARAALSAGKCRLLLSDIVLPDESGTLLASHACKHDPDLRVILMSGYVPDTELITEKWQFIRKPIDSRFLIEMIQKALSASE